MTVLRVLGMLGFVLTLVGAGFLVIYASLAEGSYEAAVRSEPWEWVVMASIVGGIAAAVAMGGLASCRGEAIRLGAVAQGIAVVVVLALGPPNLETSRSDFEQHFIALTSLVLAFDAAVLLTSWVIDRRSRLA